MVFGFCNLNMICLGVEFLVANLLDIRLILDICGCLSLILEKVCPFILQLFIQLSCLSSLPGIKIIHILHFLYFAHSSQMFCFVLIVLFCLQFSLECFYWPAFKITDSVFFLFSCLIYWVHQKYSLFLL